MTSAQELTQRITQYIMTDVAAAPPEAPPAPDFLLIEGGLLDSLGLFKVIAFVEEQFDVRIAPEEIVFENFSTINAIVNLVRGKM